MTLPPPIVPTDHPRQEIVDDVASKLVAATGAEGRVFPNRSVPTHVPDLLRYGPALAVYTLNDANDPQFADPAGVLNQRTVRLTIEIATAVWEQAASQETGPPDVTQNVLKISDAIAYAVEVLILRDETHGGIAVETEYVDTQHSISAEAESIVATTRIEFDVAYQIATDDRSDDPFEGLRALWHLTPPGVEETPDAEDVIDFEEDTP